MATARETAISNENIGLDHTTRDRLYLNRINTLDMTCQRDRAYFMQWNDTNQKHYTSFSIEYCMHIVHILQRQYYC